MQYEQGSFFVHWYWSKLRLKKIPNLIKNLKKKKFISFLVLQLLRHKQKTNISKLLYKNNWSVDEPRDNR